MCSAIHATAHETANADKKKSDGKGFQLEKVFDQI
jgi:hypothetical protein